MKTKHGILALLVAFCLLVGLLPSMAFAASEVASGTCGDNLTWVLDSDGTLTISGEGKMTSSPWTTDYAEQIKTVVIEDGVTSISSSAFYGCTSLTTIEVDPENTTYSSQDGVLFNKDMTELITCPGGKAGEYTIPNSVTSIGDYAFYNCASLTSISIPDGVTSIGGGAFSGCTSLTSVTIPDSVTSISYLAFCDCTSLTSATIGSGVTSIGSSAFYGCTSLTSVTIPASVTSISSSAFYGCTSLTTIEVDPENTTYSSQDGVLFNKDMTELITCPGGKAGEYTIPNSVTSIGSDAFSGCTSLTSVTIPDSVTSIGGHAFDGCTSLTSITIPDSVTSIAYWTFYECTSLTSVTIGSGVTSIGYYAFLCCTDLTTIVFEGDAPYFDTPYREQFLYVTATAYYPAGNETWTEDVMQDYGGIITWVAYTPGETADAVVSVAAGEGAPTTDVNVPLTSEDMTLGGIGVEVSYVLNVNAVESVSEEEKALIDAALDGNTAAIYLDITLNRTVDGNTAAVTETEEMVLITMTIPTELLGENCTYSVIRVHDGEVEILPNLDEDANTVTIQTDRFSTYVLTYSETANEPTDPEPSAPEETDPEVTDPEVTDPEVTDPEVTDPEVTDPEVTDPEASTPTGDNPKDGDFAPIMTCAVLMLLSAAAVVTIRKRVF